MKALAGFVSSCSCRQAIGLVASASGTITRAYDLLDRLTVITLGTPTGGKLIFGIFATLAEFEVDLIRERTAAGLAAARACGRTGGRQFELSKSQIRQASIGDGQLRD